MAQLGDLLARESACCCAGPYPKLNDVIAAYDNGDIAGAERARSGSDARVVCPLWSSCPAAYSISFARKPRWAAEAGVGIADFADAPAAGCGRLAGIRSLRW